MAAFEGFSTEDLVSMPASFFTTVLPQITNAAELRVTLHIFWVLSRQRGRAKRVSWDELASDEILAQSLRSISPMRPSIEVLEEGIGLAVERGCFIHLVSTATGKAENWYLANTAANRDWAERQRGLQLSRPEKDPSTRPSIFSLYEQNIGILTPMIIEELRQASSNYAQEWIEQAIHEAVVLNIRNWRYVRRILERWEHDGKQAASHRSEQDFDLDKYTTGKYADFFNRSSSD